MHNNKAQLHHLNSKLLLFIALLLTIALYLPGLGGPFLLDDATAIPQLKMSGMDWQQLLSLSFSQEHGPLRRPLASASFSLNYIFFGEETRSFKVTNLVLHLLIGVLLYLIGKNILSRCLQDRIGEKQASSIALVTATVWLIHPLHVSTVLYVVQRMTQLSSLFTLLAILVYIHGRERIIQEKSFAYTTLILGYLIFGLLGIFSKETTALLPGYILLIEVLVYKFRTSTMQAGIRDRKFLFTFGMLAILPILLGLGIFIFKIDAFLAGYLNRPFSLGERLLTESHVLWDYIQQSFLPQLSGMALHHDGYPVTSSLDTPTILAIAGLLGLAISGLLLGKKQPVIALGILWFLLSHTLESTVLALELKFEHRNYLAMYGLLLATVYGLYRFTVPARHALYAKVFLALFITFLSYQTYSRANIWADQEALFQFEARFQPNSYRLISTQINMTLLNKDFSGVREKTAHLRAIRPWDADPALLDIVLDCAEGAFSNQTKTITSTRYVTESLSLIKHAPHIGAMPFTLFNLSQLATAGLCSNISDDELIAIFNAALANPRIRERPLLQQNLMVQFARIHSASGRIQTATNLLAEAHRLRPERLNILLEKGYMELNAGDITNAKLTVQQLKTLNDALPFFRKHNSQIMELESFIKQEEMTLNR